MDLAAGQALGESKMPIAAANSPSSRQAGAKREPLRNEPAGYQTLEIAPKIQVSYTPLR